MQSVQKWHSAYNQLVDSVIGTLISFIGFELQVNYVRLCVCACVCATAWSYRLQVYVRNWRKVGNYVIHYTSS